MQGVNFNPATAELQGLASGVLTRISAINHRLGEPDEVGHGARDLESLRQLHSTVADSIEVHVARSNDDQVKIPVHFRAVHGSALGGAQEVVHSHIWIDFHLALIGVAVLTTVSDGHATNTVRVLIVQSHVIPIVFMSISIIINTRLIVIVINLRHSNV